MTKGLALVVRRTIRTTPARAFAAWTEPEQLRKWWGPRPVTCVEAEVDLRVGGVYRIGNLLPGGTVLWIAGEFEVVEPPHRLVYTWQVESPDWSAERSRVTVRFEPHPQGTEVVVVHERIETEEIRADHEKGWIGCLDGLERMLSP